jgi:hypothetical protein
MELKDLLLTPFYLVIIYIFAYRFRKTNTDKVTKRYYIPALTVKLIGAIALGLIYQYYYTGGDTYNFFENSRWIWYAFLDSPIKALDILIHPGRFNPETYEYTCQMFFYHDPSSREVIRLSAVLGFLTFHTYSINALLFACLSFSGLWALYRCFYDMYPYLHKELAISVFFIPSVFFWGSGLMKDTLCVGALGWLFYAFYQALIKKKRLTRSIIIILVSMWILKSVKVYILLAFLPPALFWIFDENSARIKSQIIRLLAKPFLVCLGLLAAYFAGTRLTEGDSSYALDKIGQRTKINAEYLYNMSSSTNGSSYSIGKLDGSISSMLSAGPQAIFIALFRPFLWEVKNPVMLLSAIEASIFLFVTCFLLYRTGPIATIKLIATKPLVVFCFIFSIIMALAVGLNSGNFGTLVRYKIPFMPFYLAGLYIMYSHTTKKRKIKSAPVTQMEFDF